MEDELQTCKACDAILLPADTWKTCRLCDALHCDECLNEAGYCTPCAVKMGYSKEEAIAV